MLSHLRKSRYIYIESVAYYKYINIYFFCVCVYMLVTHTTSPRKGILIIETFLWERCVRNAIIMLIMAIWRPRFHNHPPLYYDQRVVSWVLLQSLNLFTKWRDDFLFIQSWTYSKPHLFLTELWCSVSMEGFKRTDLN